MNDKRTVRIRFWFFYYPIGNKTSLGFTLDISVRNFLNGDKRGQDFFTIIYVSYS